MAEDHPSRQLGMSAILILSVLNILFCLFGILGNALVCLAIWRNAFLQAGVNLCIVSLSVADLLVCMFTQPFYVLSLNGYSDQTFEIVYYIVTSTSLYASLNCLLLMTMNRLIAVSYPLRFKSILSKRNITFCIIVVWILSFVEGILRTFTGFKVFTSYIRIASIIVLTAMYGKVFLIARKHKIRIKSQAKSLAFNYQLAAMKTEDRASKTAALIAGSFVVSFLPITILLMIDSTSSLLVEICFSIMCCSSSINPILYAWRSERFRAAVLELFPCFRSNNRILPIHKATVRKTIESRAVTLGNKMNTKQSAVTAVRSEGFALGNIQPTQQSETEVNQQQLGLRSRDENTPQKSELNNKQNKEDNNQASG